jgi:hypothetical protein
MLKLILMCWLFPCVLSEEAKSLSPMLLSVTSSIVSKLKILVAVGEHDSLQFRHQSCEFAEVRGRMILCA